MLLTMSESSTPSKSIKVSGPAAHAHGIPENKRVEGHEVVIKGLYFAFTKSGEKVKREYEETFWLNPAERLLSGQGALGHILSGKLLSDLLAAKDPEFRVVHTHEVVSHENVLVDAPPPRDAKGLRLDGPTLAEFVKAGYAATSYPPKGYADKRECQCFDPLDKGMTHCKDKPCFTTPTPTPVVEPEQSHAENAEHDGEPETAEQEADAAQDQAAQ